MVFWPFPFQSGMPGVAKTNEVDPAFLTAKNKKVTKEVQIILTNKSEPFMCSNCNKTPIFPTVLKPGCQRQVKLQIHLASN